MMAAPWPPPTHMVTMPYLWPSRSISPIMVMASLITVAPMGWPRAMPPPSGLTFFQSQLWPWRSISMPQAITWAAKASFSSTTPISSMVRPAFFNALGMA